MRERESEEEERRKRERGHNTHVQCTCTCKDMYMTLRHAWINLMASSVVMVFSLVACSSRGVSLAGTTSIQGLLTSLDP